MAEKPNEAIQKIIDPSKLLYLKYIMERERERISRADITKLRRLESILKNMDEYKVYRKELDNLRYNFFEKGVYIGRIPKKYRLYKEGKVKDYQTFDGSKIRKEYIKLLEKMREEKSAKEFVKTLAKNFEEYTKESGEKPILPEQPEYIQPQKEQKEKYTAQTTTPKKSSIFTGLKSFKKETSTEIKPLTINDFEFAKFKGKEVPKDIYLFSELGRINKKYILKLNEGKYKNVTVTIYNFSDKYYKLKFTPEYGAHDISFPRREWEDNGEITNDFEDILNWLNERKATIIKIEE